MKKKYASIHIQKYEKYTEYIVYHSDHLEKITMHCHTKYSRFYVEKEAINFAFKTANVVWTHEWMKIYEKFTNDKYDIVVLEPIENSKKCYFHGGIEFKGDIYLCYHFRVNVKDIFSTYQEALSLAKKEARVVYKLIWNKLQK